MLMEALGWLREAGVETDIRLEPNGRQRRTDALVEVHADDHKIRFVVEAKARSPYPNELDQLHRQLEALSVDGHPLLVAPFVSEPLGSALTKAGWSWADSQGNFDLRAPGLLLRQRRTTTPVKPAASSLPQGSGSLAIIRALIRFSEHEEEEPSVTALAAQAEVTQPRASQVMGRLHELGLVEKTDQRRWRPDRAALLDRFLAEYKGPGGSELLLYSLDPPSDVALRSAKLNTRATRVVVSADVGPDLIEAWRRPTVVIIYSEREVPPQDLGAVEAQARHDANVVVRNPDDRSAFPTPEELVAELQGTDIPLADPSQMIWDLQALGGADRLEAAGALREWLLRR